MNNLYFQFNISKVISLENLSDEYIPLALKFNYDKYSSTHNWIEFQTPANFIEIKFGKEYGELISLALVRYEHYKFVDSDLDLQNFPYHESSIGLRINNQHQPTKEPYLNGIYYTIKEICTVDIFNDAIKISLPQRNEPCFLISNNNFGILIDNDLNICSFVFTGISKIQHAHITKIAKNLTKE